MISREALIVMYKGDYSLKGKYSIRIENRRIVYQFTIRRNITVIRGNSATGKTTLIEMLQNYERDGEESGIRLRCQKNCVVLTDLRWKENLKAVHDSIVFIDEDYHFIRSRDFAAAVQESDNYYVLITRDSLFNLPYSADEIYGIHVSGKYSDLRKTYNEFFHIYGRLPYRADTENICIISEDSNSGFEFFHSVSSGKASCISAHGKSNISRSVLCHSSSSCLIIADGAAFGSEMERIMEMIHAGYRITMYLPESFEWLILKSGILKDNEIGTILNAPEDYIESREFLSWERFFTALLTNKTAGTYYRYSKASLNRAFLHSKEKNAILAVIPENIVHTICEED